MTELDGLIDRCDALLADDFDQSEADSIYCQYYIAYRKPIYQETGSQVPMPPNERTERKHIDIVRDLLISHRDKLNYQLELARAASDSTSVTNSVNVNISVTLSQTVESLDKCSLSPDELKEIKAALLDLEASKSNSAETVCDKASKVLDLVKKGADVASSVAPFVAAALQSIK